MTGYRKEFLFVCFGQSIIKYHTYMGVKRIGKCVTSHTPIKGQTLMILISTILVNAFVRTYVGYTFIQR